MRRQVLSRLRQLPVLARRQAGFGMVELLAAMTVLVVGLLAVFAMFESGIVQIRRASKVVTASAIADSEMESFRAVMYDTLGMTASSVQGADSVYTGDSAYRAVSSPENELDSAVTLASSSSVPTETVIGADNRSYRVDTYITWQALTGTTGSPSRDFKLITVVVRDVDSPYRVWARVSSAFDQSTGS